MYYYHLGNVIQELRQRESMTQEDLADNVCSVSSVSKIERGIQMPSGQVANALLSKFGMTGNFFAGFGTAEELELSENWDLLLRKAYSTQKYENEFERQIYSYIKAIDRRRDDIKEEDMLKELIECLSISVSLDDVYIKDRKKLFTYVELHIINSIAVCLYKLGRALEAVPVMGFLYEYMRNQYVDDQVKKHLFPVIANNAAVIMFVTGHKNQALFFCKEGVLACVSNHVKGLPFLYKNYSVILEKHGKKAQAEDAHKKMKFFMDLLSENPVKKDVYDRMEEPLLVLDRINEL